MNSSKKRKLTIKCGLIALIMIISFSIFPSNIKGTTSQNRVNDVDLTDSTQASKRKIQKIDPTNSDVASVDPKYSKEMPNFEINEINSWVDAKQVSDAPAAINDPEIAVDSYGNIFIVYTYFHDGYYHIRVDLSYDGGITWWLYSDVGSQVWVGNPDISICLSQHRQLHYWEYFWVNEVFIAYEYEYSDSDHDIFLRRVKEGTYAVNTDATDTRNPSLAIYGKGVYVAYEVWGDWSEFWFYRDIDILVSKCDSFLYEADIYYIWKEVGTGALEISQNTDPDLIISEDGYVYLAHAWENYLTATEIHLHKSYYASFGEEFYEKTEVFDGDLSETLYLKDVSIAVSRYTSAAHKIVIGFIESICIEEDDSYEFYENFIQVYSTDEGETWSDPDIIASEPDIYYCKIVADGMGSTDEILNNFWYAWMYSGCVIQIKYAHYSNLGTLVDYETIYSATGDAHRHFGLTSRFDDDEGWIPGLAYREYYSQQVYYASIIVLPQPGITHLISPNWYNNRGINDTTPTFEWIALPDVSEYQLQVGWFSDPDNPEISIDIKTSENSYEAPLPLTDPITAVSYWHWRVKAYAREVWGDWSDIGMFFIDTVPPDIPKTHSPKNVLFDYNLNIHFNWSWGNGAYQYQIRIWEYIPQTEDILHIDTIVNDETEYYSSIALPDGLFYWEVRAIDRAGNLGDWSSVYQTWFRVETGRSRGPELIWPGDSEIIWNTQPVLDWQDLRGSSSYRVEIDDDPTFVAPLETIPSIGNSEAFFSVLPDGNYYWRVRAKYLDSSDGPWSSIWSFTIDQSMKFLDKPTPVSPSMMSTITNNTPNFEWLSSSQATLYQLYVDDTYPFSYSPIINISTTNTYYNASTFLPDGRYKWGIRAKNDTSIWGEWWTTTFTIDSYPPEPPVVLSPEVGTTFNSSETEFKWTDVEDAIYYDFEVAENEEFSPIYYGEIAGTNETSITIPNSGQYYCRVRARDDAQTWGNFSPIISFNVNLTIHPPIYEFPINNSSVHTDTVYLRWLSINRKNERFHIQLASNSDFSLLIENITTTNLYYSNNTLPEGTYFWRVRAAAGTLPFGGWGEIWKFHLNFSATPILISPEDAATINDPTLFLQWEGIPDAYSYQLQIASTLDFQTIIREIYTSSTLIYTKPLADGDYFWRVRARYGRVDYSPWSAVKTLSIDIGGGTGPQLDYPSNDDEINDSRPYFNWIASKGAENYQIQLADSDTFVKKILDTTTNYTSYKLNNSLLDGEYYWRVRSYYSENSVWGPWSTVGSFNLVGVFSEIPLLVSPASGEETNTTPTLEWESLPYKSINYQIQLSDSDEFSTLVVNETTTTNKFTITNSLSGGIHFWRVRAKDSTHDWGFWSKIKYFYSSGIFSGIPVLLLPKDEAIFATSVPNLEWTTLKGAALYQVQVSTFNDFIKKLVDTETTSTSYPIVASLSENTYYWRVRAKDRAHDWGGWSETWFFTIGSSERTTTPSESVTTSGRTGNGSPGWSLGLTIISFSFLFIMKFKRRKCEL